MARSCFAATLAGDLSPLSLASDLSPADWIVESLTTFAESVTSLVPSGYPANVRVFHPGQMDGRPVSWAEVAGANGKPAHGGMQLHTLTGLDDRDVQPGVFDVSPEEGCLPEELRGPLVHVLRSWTTTPDRCLFAFWHGWGGFEARMGYSPTLCTPGREYILFAGALEGVHEDPDDGYNQSASIWWPDDHAWCFATEVDLRSTYIGCSETCRGDLLAQTSLEAYEIDPGTGIDGRSDTLNPA